MKRNTTKEPEYSESHKTAPQGETVSADSGSDAGFAKKQECENESPADRNGLFPGAHADEDAGISNYKTALGLAGNGPKKEDGECSENAQDAKESASDKAEDADYLRRRKLVSIVSIIVLIVFFIVAYFTIGKPMLATVSNPESFRKWVGGHGVLGWLAMIGMMALQVIVAIIPGEPIEVGAGYAFGTWGGMALCLAGAAIGQLIIFLFVRKFGTRLVEAFISREKMQSIKFINDSRRLELLTFVLFLIPGTPKDALAYFAGLTPINMWRFIVITTIARIPSVITSTIVGRALGDGELKTAVIVFVATVVVSALGILAYRLYSTGRSKEKKEEDEK